MQLELRHQLGQRKSSLDLDNLVNSSLNLGTFESMFESYLVLTLGRSGTYTPRYMYIS